MDVEPGVHRFRFIVDGIMRTSDDYLRATDAENMAVNYIPHKILLVDGLRMIDLGNWTV
jgi:Glycogen recognition site of AMP-activated protein kinase